MRMAPRTRLRVFGHRTQLNFEPYGSRRKDLVEIFAPVRALGAQGIGNEDKREKQNKRPEAIASGFLFWLPLLDLNQRHPD